MAKFDIKTVKPKFVVTTSPENKIDVVVNKPIITSKVSKSFFQLKNTGGPAGKPGRDGQDGESATIEVASTTTLPAGSPATVENVGTDSSARLAFGIPKGDDGAAGADGQAATIQVGQVETLQPNQQCYVENVGSPTAAIFNIGIPKGEKGDSGSGSGDMTAATYDPNGTVAAAGGIPDYVDSNGGKIDTIKVNGTAQTITNKTVDLSVPTKTSDITNDSGYVTSTDYATNATGGVIKTTGAFGVDMSNSGEIKGTIVSSADYSAMWNDAIVSKGTLENALSTKGYALSTDIPTVNDATLTIQHNGTNVQTFTANQGTNATANIETIYAETITPTTDVATIGTTQIADGAVTSAKIDWSTIYVSAPQPSENVSIGGLVDVQTITLQKGKWRVCWGYRYAHVKSTVGYIESGLRWGNNTLTTAAINVPVDSSGNGRIMISQSFEVNPGGPTTYSSFVNAGQASVTGVCRADTCFLYAIKVG